MFTVELPVKQVFGPLLTQARRDRLLQAVAARVEGEVHVASGVLDSDVAGAPTVDRAANACDRAPHFVGGGSPDRLAEFVGDAVGRDRASVQFPFKLNHGSSYQFAARDTGATSWSPVRISTTP